MPFMKYLYAPLALLLIQVTPAQAKEVPLSGDKIIELLSNNSVMGLHYGTETRQYFSETGLTLWMKEDDARPSEGRWKVESDQYCASWDGNWGCFQVLHDDVQGLYYFYRRDYRAPFVPTDAFSF